METAKSLGISQKVKPLQPLVPKKKFRQSVEEKMTTDRKDLMLEALHEAGKDKQKTNAQVLQDVKERKREKLENQ